MTEAVAQAAITMADHLGAAALVALTETGFTARSISKYRPGCPILAVTPSLDVVRRLSMNWGVTGVHFEGETEGETDDEAAWIGAAIQAGRELQCIRSGDVIVATGGVHRESGTTNQIRVVTAED